MVDKRTLPRAERAYIRDNWLVLVRVLNQAGTDPRRVAFYIPDWLAERVSLDDSATVSETDEDGVVKIHNGDGNQTSSGIKTTTTLRFGSENRDLVPVGEGETAALEMDIRNPSDGIYVRAATDSDENRAARVYANQVWDGYE